MYTYAGVVQKDVFIFVSIRVIGWENASLDKEGIWRTDSKKPIF